MTKFLDLPLYQSNCHILVDPQEVVTIEEKNEQPVLVNGKFVKTGYSVIKVKGYADIRIGLPYSDLKKAFENIPPRTCGCS